MPTNVKERSEETKDASKVFTSSEKKRNDAILQNIDELLDKLNLSLYGTIPKSDQEDLTDQFNNIIKSQTDGILRSGDESVTSFLSDLFAKERKSGWGNPDLETFLNSEDGQITNFLSDAYQNKMLKYADLNEIASQLIELREAILIMRDSIISPDTTEGSISRDIDFDFESEDEKATKLSKIESIEKTFHLKDKIKNHIVPKTLTYGEYRAYCIPYSKVFMDFTKKKEDPISGNSYMANMSMYRESTLSDSYLKESAQEKNPKAINDYCTECAKDFISQFNKSELESMSKDFLDKPYNEKAFLEEVSNEIHGIMDNISVSNDPVPIPFLTEGVEALEMVAELYLDNSVNNIFMEVAKADSTDDDLFTEVSKITNKKRPDSERSVYDTKEFRKTSKKIKNDFSDVKDCYIKLCDPMHMIPFKILNKTVGYYYIQEEDIKAVNGIVQSSIFMNKYDSNGKQKTIVDMLANNIAAAFDKKFLRKNAELKELIAEALMYYDLSSKKIKFQFVPIEYVCEFKVNVDENGNGVSMIEPSLFYAKLYLLLLLFKIVSIILYSNDQKINYVRTSGVDRNVTNKVQEIAREKQNHQINIMDLMSYTTLLRKIGNGTEMYIPVGRNNERGFETEILQGQDIQINNELMELLRNSYILGTGVPSAIMNYLNEADFAKSIETANTRFQGRVMSYQLDFNESITAFYRLVAKQSGVMTDEDLVGLSVTLTPPKFANNMIKSEALNAFNTLREFVLNLFLGDGWQNDPNNMSLAKELTKYLIDKFIPALDIQSIEEELETIKLKVQEEKLNPANNNTDNIDDFSDDLGNLGNLPQ